ncbi:uncharacterized protein LOC108266945 [Ictalurus punctatus]|uniref:Uncharacterized protein LOC108266945 n=1 Tax=Ictalurus punctatus TaxID=7998 RepID=A0A9F7TL45_ICTPU|nr:uncharacterized protein LOC108266945 [Ictalurus punctatus]
MFCKSFNNMQRNINMALIQIRNLHLGLCTIVFLLTCGDCTKPYEKNILHQINRTASKGETVVFHCNGTLTSELKDIGWRKDGNGIFIQSSVINQTVFNYTSSRMQVNPRNPRELQISDVQLSDKGLYLCFPLDMQWILTIEDKELQQKTTKQLYIVTVPSVTGAAAICVIIFCAVCIHRKYKKKEASDQTDTMDNHQPHGGRMNRNQSSQYFERFNSVYGEIQI